MKKEEILKVLKKYGFYSLNRAPYLYENNDRCGVYFIFPSKHYGNLERVLFFDDEESLEDEIYKYWWFLNHKNELDIEVLFDNYEVLSPKVTYYFKNAELSSFIMKNFATEEKNMIDDETIHKKKQLLRTANILIQLLQEKLKIQNETYLKVLDLQENLKKLTITFKQKLNLYNKTNETFVENYELLRDDSNESETFIHSLQEELSTLDSILNLKEFIKKVFSCLKEIDKNDIHLQNIYLLDRFPIEIEDIKKKIDILDESLTNKKKIKSKKNNVELLLNEVDTQSACLHLTNVNIYIEQEKNRIEKKYVDCQMIEDEVLGDHLLTLENISIEIPEKLEDLPVDIHNPEILFADLKSVYEKLSEEEKSACHIASSFLSECLNQLMSIPSVKELSINEIISQLVLKKQIHRFNDAYSHLDHYLNVKIRLNYLKILKVDTFETFIESLLNAIEVLNRVDIKIKHSFVAYYSNKEKNIIPIHLRKICYLEQNESFIAYFKANVSLYYSPIQIVKPLDVLEVSELDVKENETLFMLQNKVKVETKRERIPVVKYKKDKVVKVDDFIVIIEMNENNKCIYYEDFITSLESE